LAGKNGVTEVPAVSIQPLDTLGGGDTFIAHTLVGLLNGEEPAKLLSAASEAAGETCKRISAFGYPAPIEIDESQARTLGEIYNTSECSSAAGEAG
jgi:fructoselysine 6-kinase